MSNNPINVLVVDDEPSARMALVFCLKKDYCVFEADSVASAEKAARATKFAVALLDIRLAQNGDEGFAAARILREINPQMKIIFVSAHAGDDNLATVVMNGPVAILHKPANKAQILSAVASATAEHATTVAAERTLTSAAKTDERDAIFSRVTREIRQTPLQDIGAFISASLRDWAEAGTIEVWRVLGRGLASERQWLELPADLINGLLSGGVSNVAGYEVLVAAEYRSVKCAISLRTTFAYRGATREDMAFLGRIAGEVAAMHYQVETAKRAAVDGALALAVNAPASFPALGESARKKQRIDLCSLVQGAPLNVIVRTPGHPVLCDCVPDVATFVAEGLLAMAKASVKDGKQFEIRVGEDATIVAHSSTSTIFGAVAWPVGLFGGSVGVCQLGLMGGTTLWVRL